VSTTPFVGLYPCSGSEYLGQESPRALALKDVGVDAYQAQVDDNLTVFHIVLCYGTVDNVDKCVDNRSLAVCAGDNMWGRVMQKIKPGMDSGRCSAMSSALLLGVKAFAAINRTIVARFEGYLGGYAAFGTNGFVHFPRGPGVAAIPAASARITTFAATGGFVFKTLFGVEFLFAGREDEIASAVFAL
jgi:hypothetical protein